MNRITKDLFLVSSTILILFVTFQISFCTSKESLIRELSNPDNILATQGYECQTCFYVSKNNPTGCNDRWSGTETEPWCTIKKAANTLRAGDTVFIKEGIYYERLVPVYSGTPDKNITYQNYENDEVIINGGRTIAREGVLVEGKSYLNFKGLIIKGWDLAGFSVEGPATKIMIDELTIENNNYGIRFRGKPGEEVTDSVIINSMIQNNRDSGVFIYRTCEDILIDHNLITNNATENIEDYTHGIEVVVWNDDKYSGNGPRYVTITNNEISFNNTQGIMTWDADYILIQNNYIHHNGATGVQIEDGTNFAIIENNLIENNSQGHEFEGGIWVDDAENIVVQNNTLRGNKMGLIIGRSGLTLVRHNFIYHNNDGVKHNKNSMGINVNYSTRDSILVHNTLFKNGNRETQRAGLSIASYTDKDEDHTNKVERPRVKNNIFSETLADIDLWIGNQAEDYVSDCNVFYNTRDLVVHYEDHNMTWEQYLLISSQDNNSITTNPFFSDPDHGNFTLVLNSQAIDGGGTLTETTMDGKGTTIPVNDARYFSNGFGLVDGDFIQVGQNPPIKVIHVDYTQNLITVDTAISWQKGDGVSYPYSGSAPDIGALERISTPLK